MKTFYSTLLIFFLAISHFSLATNYNNSGVKVNYTLLTGDTLRITGGTFNGKILSFTPGAVIIVSATAVFDPENMGLPSGKIINYGVCEFGSLGTYANFKFENYSLVRVSGNLSLYDGNTQIWNNNVAATMQINGDFSMNNAVFTNYATMSVGDNFSLYTATSNFINKGLLTVKKDISMSNGVLRNQNRIYVEDVNAWGGQLINEGSISPEGDIVFGNGSTYTNACVMITNKGFTNYGTFNNNGLLWVGRTGTNDDHFYNSGTFTNAANAAVRAIKFTNYSNLAGGGSYYITRDSYTSGTIGRSGTTTDSIKVYDVTRTSSSRIFDTQWGTVHPNVVYRPFAQPDTNSVNYTGCSSLYKMDLAVLLPVEWNYFTAKLVGNQPQLSWSAQYEANMKFDVERSFDNVHFETIKQVLSNKTKQYTLADEKAGQNITVYYRIKATGRNGAAKYSETKSVNTGGTSTVVSVFPNPVTSTASIQFQADRYEQVTIRISNAAGQQILSRSVTTAKGLNNVSFTEAAQWKAGIYFIELMKSTNTISTERFIKQ